MSRREFLELAVGLSAASFVDLSLVKKVIAGHGDPSAIWLQGQSCSGCSVSLLNSVNLITVDDLLLNTISLEYHSTLIAAAGDLALPDVISSSASSGEFSALDSQGLQTDDRSESDPDASDNVSSVGFAELAEQGYVLIVEGAIPLGADGRFCEVGAENTMIQAFDKLSDKATNIIAIGTCAAYGGIPGAMPNPTNALGVRDALAHVGRTRPLVNIPGCPAHPDWFVGTLSYILANGATPELDADLRPIAYFGTSIHDACPFRGRKAPVAENLGQEGCTERLGCNGKQTFADCPNRMWNSGGAGQSGVNWCIGARNPCQGCTESGFPDAMTPFYTL